MHAYKNGHEFSMRNILRTNTLYAKSLDGPGFLAVILTAATWGLTGIFVRWLSGISPILITTGRLIISLIVILPVMLLVQRFRRALYKDLNRKLAWILALLLILYYTTAVFAFETAPVAHVALLISTSPLFVLVYRTLMRTRMHSREILGAIIGVVGVAAITLGDGPFSAPDWIARLKGYGFALCAAWATATYAIVYRTAATKKAAPQPGSVAVIACTAGSLGLGAWASAKSVPFENIVSPDVIYAFLALGLVSTAIPSVTYAVASKRLPVIVTTTGRLSTPIFATIFAAVILQENPSVWTIPGGTMVLFGMYLVVSLRDDH